MHYARTVYGYHGCKATTAEAILGGSPFRASVNQYDWLGEGIYFWEYGLRRAWSWAKALHDDEAAVVGAHVHLGDCFDLLDTQFTEILKTLAPTYAESVVAGGGALPKNEGRELKKRYFDCALLNWSLTVLADQGQRYQTVRCAFIEGSPVYDDGRGVKAEIFEESHIQLVVRDPSCILGTFRPSGGVSGTSL